MKIVGSRVIVALLNGTLEFLQLQTFTHGKPVDWNFTCAYRRTHIRTGSAGSISDRIEFLQVNISRRLINNFKMFFLRSKTAVKIFIV